MLNVYKSTKIIFSITIFVLSITYDKKLSTKFIMRTVKPLPLGMGYKVQFTFSLKYIIVTINATYDIISLYLFLDKLTYVVVATNRL